MKKPLIIVILIFLSLLLYSSESRLFLCSWYGHKFDGKKTANGEIFDSWKDTCATFEYPIGVHLLIYYPRTKKSVIVRVNDRGPFILGRSIDISEHAAKMIGLKSIGTDYVYVTLLD